MGPNEVLQGLVAKRAEPDGQLEWLGRERRVTVDDIAALDRAAQVFDAAYVADNAARNRKPRGPTIAFARRELIGLIGQVLRNAYGPITTTDVAAAMAERKQVPADHKPRRSRLAVRVRVTLNGLEKSKAVRGSRVPGERVVRWTPARWR